MCGKRKKVTPATLENCQSYQKSWKSYDIKFDSPHVVAAVVDKYRNVSENRESLLKIRLII